MRVFKDFKKVSLKPSESAEVSFKVTEDMLKYYTAANRFESENGDFKAFIGFDSTTENEYSFCLK